MKKKVAIVGTSAGLPAAYGGFETLAENLVKNLAGSYDFVVDCKRTPRKRRQSSFLGARLNPSASSLERLAEPFL